MFVLRPEGHGEACETWRWFWWCPCSDVSSSREAHGVCSGHLATAPVGSGDEARPIESAHGGDTKGARCSCFLPGRYGARDSVLALPPPEVIVSLARK